MKKIAIIASIVAIAFLSYFLFEPVFTYWISRTEPPSFKGLLPTITHNNPVSEKADELLVKEFQRLKAPSLSVSIGIDDSVIWSNSIGYSDVENKRLVDSRTKYRIGSVSKTIASIGLGLLFQSKTLNPNSIVGDYVPYVTDDLGALTVKELASHTSGIRNYGTCMCLPLWEYYDNDHYSSVEESVKIFVNDKLLFSPGTSFSYSSYNYTLLSGVIEGVSESSYNEYIHHTILEPFGMGETVPEDTRQPASNTAVFYDYDDDFLSISFAVDNSSKWAGGGYLSTPADLVRFGNGILNNRILDKANTLLLFNPVRLKNGEINEQNYALGWRNDLSRKVFSDGREVRVIHHGGTAVGSTAILVLIPEYNVSVAVAINKSGSTAELFDVAFKLVELFMSYQRSEEPPSS